MDKARYRGRASPYLKAAVRDSQAEELVVVALV
jgi:hypothetical protein